MRTSSGQWLIIGALTVAASAPASAQAWKGFTHVDDVCPTCTTGPAYDRVQLKNGQEVRARVVAENEAFYVLERFGEWRALGRDQVANIARNAATTHPAAALPDQILLKDETVIAGTIDGDVSNAVGSFTINVPGTPVHHEARATVAAVYRGGKKIWTADAAPTAQPAPATQPAPAAPAPAR